MSKLTKIALGCVSAAVVVGALVAWFVYEPASPSSPAPPGTRAEVGGDVPVTVQLHVINADTVQWTCERGGEVKLCGPDPVSAAGVWSRTVTVLAGMTVQVIPAGGVIPPRCSIADEADTTKLTENTEGGECEWVAK
jgi:hypothetical protein